MTHDKRPLRPRSTVQWAQLKTDRKKIVDFNIQHAIQTASRSLMENWLYLLLIINGKNRKNKTTKA